MPFHDVKKKYSVVKKIGAGGMGEVFRARNDETGEIVALKVLPESLSHNEEVRSRFLREMVTCAKLNHPHIIRVFDYGHASGTLYYVMEYIPGQSVAELIEQRGALPVRLALLITAQMLEALSYIHDRNLVHRDVKPSNVQVTGLEQGQERAVLMDFGLVKAFDSQLTRTGRVLGTPRYIAPEMLSTGTVDARSDIFQLGIILYEMVAGGYAFKGATRAEVARNALTANPEPASLLNPDVDVNLDNIIFNAIEKDPDERYVSAAEMLQDLRAHRRGKRIYRRQKRRSSERSVKLPILEAIEADDPDVAGYLDLGTEKLDSSSFVRMMPWLIPVFIIPLLLVYYLGREPVYSARGVQVEAAVDRAVIRWGSDVAYPSVIQFGRNRDSMAVVSARDARAVVEHRLELTDLRENTSYLFQVVFPDGEVSEDHSFDTLAFELSNVTAVYTSAGRLDVSWRSNVPARGSVEVYFGERVVRAFDEGFSRIHRMIVDVPDPRPEIRLRVSGRTEAGSETELERVGVPSIVRLGDELRRDVESFEPESFFRRLRRDGRQIPRRRHELNALVESLAEFKEIRDSIRSFAPVSNRFFSDPHIPVLTKVGVYDALSRLFIVDAVIMGYGGDPPFRTHGLLHSPFSLVEGSTLRSSTGVENLSMGIASFDGLVPDPELWDGSETVRASLFVPLLLLRRERYGRGELQLTLRGMTPFVRVEAAINDDVVLRYHALGRYRPDERIVLSHEFPVELLHNGPNELRLSVVPLADEPMERAVQVEDVTFNFQLAEER